jgi:hypothetical protein
MTDTDDNPARLTEDQRLTLLERDAREHARALTGIVERIGKGFTDEQIDQIRTAFRQELAEAGLRLDEPEHQDAAREDFRFVRRLRLAWDGAVKKVGNAVLLAIVGVVAVIFGLGFWAWINQNIGGGK